MIAFLRFSQDSFCSLIAQMITRKQPTASPLLPAGDVYHEIETDRQDVGCARTAARQG